MSKVNDIYDGWVVREEENFGEFFCTGNGPSTYIFQRGRHRIGRKIATPTEKRSQI
jgi:hypothetical protein